MSSFTPYDKEVCIIGAGWSGLACAVKLCQHGYKVTLLESSKHEGGRARNVTFKHFMTNQAMDNGQHIMLGAYHSTLKLFKQIGIQEKDALFRQSLELNLYSKDHPFIRLKSSKLPAPLNLLYAFLKMHGLTLNERLKIIKMATQLAISNYQLKEDVSVQELLKTHSQPKKVVKALWEPLCLATMNTPIQVASARVFLNVLKDSFSHSRKDSDLLFFKQSLSDAFVTPALKYICSNGGRVLSSEKIISITKHSKKNQCNEALFTLASSTNQYHCSNLVIATQAEQADKLLKTISEQSLLKPNEASLNFQYEPICTVYLQYTPSIRLPKAMIGLFGTMAQWAIDRSVCNQPGLIAVVISGPGEHIKMQHKQLANTVHNELSKCTNDRPQLQGFQVITEKRATFSCQTNIDQQRPENTTSCKGLYLAGDYTDTHYPATLEGAIRSGEESAQKIINMGIPFTH
ncbi:MAG: NAD(P)-binding protein [Gammaproteobacteria bacterium]|nr:NAD(P)-binding protein [Gammaproteobacteria bacterium]